MSINIACFFPFIKGKDRIVTEYLLSTAMKVQDCQEIKPTIKLC
jgi:hypothetical protein